MDSIIFFDKELTLLINGLNCPALDAFFYAATSTWLWLPLFATILWMILRRQGGRGLMTVVVIALLILIADQLTSGLMKPLFHRLRPTHDPVMQYLVHTVAGYHGGLYGFASSHAANTFALATFLTLVVRRWSLSLALFAWAAINSYGRIYQGVHFLGDVIVGVLIGIAVGRLAYEAYLHLVLHFFVINHHNKWTLKGGLAKTFGSTEPNVVTFTFWLTIILSIIFISLLCKFHGAAC
ncbi:MAG: phosphatase PAP2 family protein [Marinilabiliaceae bacterium]